MEPRSQQAKRAVAAEAKPRPRVCYVRIIQTLKRYSKHHHKSLKESLEDSISWPFLPEIPHKYILGASTEEDGIALRHLLDQSDLTQEKMDEILAQRYCYKPGSKIRREDITVYISKKDDKSAAGAQIKEKLKQEGIRWHVIKQSTDKENIIGRETFSCDQALLDANDYVWDRIAIDLERQEWYCDHLNDCNTHGDWFRTVAQPGIPEKMLLPEERFDISLERRRCNMGGYAIRPCCQTKCKSVKNVYKCHSCGGDCKRSKGCVKLMQASGRSIRI